MREGNATLKVYKGYPHDMATIHADMIDADLLPAFEVYGAGRMNRATDAASGSRATVAASVERATVARGRIRRAGNGQPRPPIRKGSGLGEKGSIHVKT